ncbi:MAG: GGDEF domain-containing protein [Chloroflexota bacterium]
MTVRAQPSDPAMDPLADVPAAAGLVRTPGADDRLVRRLDWIRLVIATAVALLGLAALDLLLVDGPQLVEVLVGVLVASLALALLLHHRVAAAIAVRRASREASMTRILQGLSRSLSPDAVVEAIVQELTSASGADHVVVARVRQPDQVVEVTLSAARASVPPSRTYLRPDVPPLSIDVEPGGANGHGAAALGLPPTASPVLSAAARQRAATATAAATAASARLEASAARAAGLTAVPIVPDDRPTWPADALPVAAHPGAARTATVAAEETEGVLPVRQRGASASAVPSEADRSRARRPAFGPFGGVRAVDQQVPGRRAQLASQSAADEIARRVRSAYGLPYTLAAPLVAEGRFLGALILSKRTRESWADGDRRLLGWAAREVAAAFARAYALEEAERGAHTDALTGLPNRRSFDDLIAAVPPRRRANDDLGILMVDIDRFKRLNDQHGHATGDAVLRAVAGAIAATVRAEDTPARYGGEEFAVILRRASAPQATEVAERVRRAVATIPPERLAVDTAVTVSVGVAVAGPEEDIAAVIERADQALYLAKRRGRDRVEVG